MRFLFVCTGNVARSPAAEAVLRRLGGGAHETRSAGVSPFSPRPLGEADLAWADVAAVMEEDHAALVARRWPQHAAKLRVLEIEDRFHRDDPALERLLETRLADLLVRLEVV